MLKKKRTTGGPLEGKYYYGPPKYEGAGPVPYDEIRSLEHTFPEWWLEKVRRDLSELPEEERKKWGAWLRKKMIRDFYRALAKDYLRAINAELERIFGKDYHKKTDNELLRLMYTNAGELERIARQAGYKGDRPLTMVATAISFKRLPELGKESMGLVMRAWKLDLLRLLHPKLEELLGKDYHKKPDTELLRLLFHNAEELEKTLREVGYEGLPLAGVADIINVKKIVEGGKASKGLSMLAWDLDLLRLLHPKLEELLDKDYHMLSDEEILRRLFVHAPKLEKILQQAGYKGSMPLREIADIIVARRAIEGVGGPPHLVMHAQGLDLLRLLHPKLEELLGKDYHKKPDTELLRLLFHNAEELKRLLLRAGYEGNRPLLWIANLISAKRILEGGGGSRSLVAFARDLDLLIDYLKRNLRKKYPTYEDFERALEAWKPSSVAFEIDLESGEVRKVEPEDHPLVDLLGLRGDSRYARLRSVIYKAVPKEKEELKQAIRRFYEERM